MAKIDNTLALYLEEINRIPLLTREEENELTARAKNGDKLARERVVNANLRFVVNVAKKYMHSGMELEDLISEGNVGLLTAIDKFDASKGYHFISYAVWWIRQSILKAIYEKKDAIRLPLNRVNELVKIKGAKKSLAHHKSEEQEIRDVAESLGMDSAHVRELLQISAEPISLDAGVSGGDENSSVGDFIEDRRYESPEEHSLKHAMRREINGVLGTLKPKEANVLKMRYGLNGTKAMSLKEVGDACSLTKERIRQIEKGAIERVRIPAKMKRLDAYFAA